jgi:isopenicillin N synthase-like dioxygenase
MQKLGIPQVDLVDFQSDSPERRTAFVTRLGQALEEIGFVAIANPGLDSQLVAQAYASAQAFFALPDSVKQQYEIPRLNGQRGFTSLGKEHAKDQPAPDLKEFWHLGQELPQKHPLKQVYPANLWPREVPDFYPTFLNLYQQLEICANTLLEACAIYLQEPPGLFQNMATNGNTILRVLHYPALDTLVPRNQVIDPRANQTANLLKSPDCHNPYPIRAAAHEDINLITLLCEATEPGLELLQLDGSWKPIHSLQGQVICNCGDMLQWVTNGLFKSATHRVVNGDDRHNPRFSMPLFLHPRPEVDLTPLPSCIARTGNQVKFPPITAAAYLQKRLEEIGLST